LFIWVTFLGASIACYEKTHINVDLFIDKVKNVQIKNSLLILANILTLSFLGLLIVKGCLVSSRVFIFGQKSASMDFLPIGLVYLAVPLGSLFMALNIVMHSADYFKKIVNPEEGE